MPNHRNQHTNINRVHVVGCDVVAEVAEDGFEIHFVAPCCCFVLVTLSVYTREEIESNGLLVIGRWLLD